MRPISASVTAVGAKAAALRALASDEASMKQSSFNQMTEMLARWQEHIK